MKMDDSSAEPYRMQKDVRQVVGDTPIQSRNDTLFDEVCEDECSEDLDDNDHMMPGLLQEGIPYTVKRVLSQGWVHKKGTGQDWIASRAWKERWAVLALAKISGHHPEIPMLQIFWSPSAPAPSTVILLNSAVILPMDEADLTKWNCHRFEIRHVRKPVDDSFHQISRIFSCPQERRDSWVYAMNTALLEYEKEKAHSRKSPSSPPRSTSTAWTEAVANFPNRQLQKKRYVSRSPPTSMRRSVPLPEPPLAGLDILDQD